MSDTDIDAAAPRSRADLDELAALEEQRSFLLRSLEDLDREHEAGDLDDADHETLRADYTARAAAVLRAIEEHHELHDVAPPTHRGVRRVLLVGAVAVIAVVAGLVVTSTSGGRTTSSTTGAQELTPSKATQACISETTSAFAASAQGSSNPSMVTDALAAMKCYTARLAEAPDDAVAYAYRGWTTALLARQVSGALPVATVTQLVEQARKDLAKARELAPRYPEALVYSAINALWSEDIAGAKDLLAQIDALQLPANSPVLAQVNRMLRPALQAAEASTTTAASGATATSSAPTTTAPSPAG